MVQKVTFVSINSYGLFNEKCKQTFGGAEVQIYLLAKELAKDKNYDVSVIVGDFGQKKVELYDDVRVVKAYSLKKTFFNYLFAPFKLFFSLKKLNPDVVVQRSAAAETGVCAFFCKIFRKKFIYSVAHDMDVSGEFASRGITGRIYNYGLKNASKIIFQNIDQVKLYEKLKKKSIKNPTIIKSGYGIKKTDISKKEYILWVSRSDSWKQPELFLELAMEFLNEKFVMIMPKSSNVKLWNRIYQDSKHIKNLEFIEKVPFSQIYEYFNRAKIFVNTSKYEGFPNTFIQACMGGTPIVSLNVNPDDFLEKNKVGFHSQNFENLKDDMSELLGNKNIYKEYSQNSLYYVKEYHNIQKIIDKWKNEFL